MKNSQILFERAKHCLPGGVNSPVRAFGAVGGTPPFFEKASGAFLFDVDGNRYIDYVGSWGPMILGHNDPDVVSEVIKTIEKTLSFGAPCELEVLLAEKVCSLIPSIDMIRFVNSGTEATMTAIRLARGFTNRNKIVKFAGCYHGHSDSLLVKGGSGLLTFGVPTSAGVPNDFTKHTFVAEFNNLTSIENIFKQCGHEIAAIIIEPIPGNMGCILPDKTFLKGLREICDHYKSLLIFDEVITGFRVGLEGAQSVYKIKPDLTTLGKIIGGGMPVGALGGSTAIMEHLSPLGPVYQAGTLSGNPVAMAAGLATLNKLVEPDFYKTLSEKTSYLTKNIAAIACELNIPMTYNQIGSMFSFFFTSQSNINCYEEVMNCNVERFAKFYNGMLNEKVFFGPSAFETSFISIAHTQKDLDETIAAAKKVFKLLN